MAVFRPDDERMAQAIEILESLAVEPVPDPMLEIRPTGATPRTDAAVTILTSKTGVELAEGWTPGETRLVAIGPSTAEAAEAVGFEVDLIPDAYTSAGLVDALAGSVAGKRVEVARSDHGSAVLTDGLNEAGAYVHETVLYELTTPDDAGESVELAAAGELDAALFTSSLTVEHFLAIASERGIEAEVRTGLAQATVGAIGSPTAETAASMDLSVDVVPADADFEALARAVVAELD
ncbi:uroporphyrinogen III methyltransferase [Halodesulfurarchaeum formicicum]|uniref:Uroporphyrinogen III methyltransferase n=1 Tax=Halodesulfurarchaeum formicicum TaxID=1873524 RepID=A0A1D8S1N4_9EURY|nr:uroporphyrinogen III methyltransferase [Halodesulfurarchaeum formicicum]